MRMGEFVYPFYTRIAGINVRIDGDKLALAAAAAEFVAGCLQRAIQARGQAVMILATGASQYEFLDALKRTTGVDWERVTAFHLDEYLGIAAEHPASFRRYLHERVFSQLRFGAIHLLQGEAADPQAEAQRYARLLAQHIVDIACIGIGENGHLAFNDPPADFQTRVGVQTQTLDLACRRQQVGEGHFAAIEEVPKQALTLTIPAILAARTISCVTPDQRKAAPVQAALEGPLSPACPASALRTHPDCHLFLDPASAARLALVPPAV